MFGNYCNMISENLFFIFKCTHNLTNLYSSPFIVTIFCAIIMGQGYATARAQLVSYIIFTLEIYFIEMFNQTKNKKYAIGLILLSRGIGDRKLS